MFYYPIRKNFYSQVLLRMITNRYFSIMVIYSTLNDNGLSVSNSIHKILLCTTGTEFHYKREYKEVFPWNMLAYLVTYNSSVLAVYIEVIDDIKFNYHILHKEKRFIQHIHDKNHQHFCYNFCSSAYAELSLLSKKWI